MSKNRKHPVFGKDAPRAGKTAVITPPEEGTNWMRACWRIQKLQLVDPYGWHELTASEIEQMRTKLAQFEEKTWNQIFVDAKKWNHSVVLRQN